MNTAPPSPAQLRRARARVLVLLAALAEPGLSLQEIARRTRLDPETVRLRVADLAAEDMLVVQGLNAGRGRRVLVYPVPAPDEDAAARLHALTGTQHASRADIRSVSA